MSADPKSLVLVVDDDDAARYVKCRRVRGAGYEVIEASNAQEALDLARTAQPDLILLDIGLPDMDGFELCRVLRQSPETSSAAIIHISETFQSSEDRIRGLEGGADGYLTAGVDPHVLVATIGAAIRVRSAERRLRESEERLRLALRHSPLACYTLDRELRYTWTSAALTPHGGKGMLGRRIDEIMPPEVAEEMLAIQRQVLESGEGVRRELGFPVGVETHYFDLTIEPTRDAAGLITGLSIAAMDITDRRLAEENARQAALRAGDRAEVAEERARVLQAILDHVPEGICVAEGPDEIIRSVSRRGLELIGRPATEVIGVSLREHGERWGFRPVDPAPHEAAGLPMVRAARDGENVTNEEWVLERPDGTSIPILCNAGPIWDGRGRVSGSILVFRDISERKAAERERAEILESEREARGHAERLNHVKDEFLATLSHELRSPINAVLGWAQILRRGPASERDLSQGLEAIERNARLQVELIGDLLDMSRLTSGKLRIDARPIDLAQVIASAVDSIRPTAQNRHIIIDVRGVHEPVVVHGDAGRLQQVLWNLLSNAVKFTPPAGHVEVALRPDEDTATITVRDTGEGIAPDFLPHVFERFRQGDASPSRRHGGLGIGLALVKQLVELHDGVVAAASEGRGKGATFTVTLPLAVRSLSASHPAEASARPSKLLTGVRVLAVDDDPDARGVIERVLVDAGADVRIAGSAAEALSLIPVFRPQLLVSDIGMPGHDGFELIRRIRKSTDEQMRSLPAIALTALARPNDRSRALHAGYQGHVVKPFLPAEIVSVLSTLLSANEA